jgi:hypothetical protein
MDNRTLAILLMLYFGSMVLVLSAQIDSISNSNQVLGTYASDEIMQLCGFVLLYLVLGWALFGYYLNNVSNSIVSRARSTLKNSGKGTKTQPDKPTRLISNQFDLDLGKSMKVWYKKYPKDKWEIKKGIEDFPEIEIEPNILAQLQMTGEGYITHKNRLEWDTYRVKGLTHQLIYLNFVKENKETASHQYHTWIIECKNS